MTEIVLFHHAQGLTAGCHAFADALRAAGHVVHTPDVYDGNTFATLDEGIAYAKQVGFEAVMERGVAAAASLPAEVVYGGWSLGGMPAQQLAMTKPGAKGLLLLHTAIPLEEFGGTWPEGVPLQVHTMTDDGWGDADVAQGLGETVPGAEVYLYPGDRHLFTDESLPDHDPDAAALVRQRALAFLAAIG